MDRRDALGILGLASLGGLVSHALGQSAAPAAATVTAPPAKNPISLAQWSLHRRFGLCKPEERPSVVADPMDFGKFAREEFGITRLELVNSFYRPRIAEKGFASGEVGMRGGGMREGGMRGGGMRGSRGAPALGCHSIRVNAIGEGTADEQAKRCADGLVKLLARAKPYGRHVIVENHGGLSSDGGWVVGVIKAVNDPACGTLPDFGNWRDGSGTLVDPVRNVGLVVPFAKGVSAQSYDFDDKGTETLLDYPKLIEVVKQSGYTGAIGIEYEGKRLSEPDGIRATKALLERLI